MMQGKFNIRALQRQGERAGSSELRPKNRNLRAGARIQSVFQEGTGSLAENFERDSELRYKLLVSGGIEKCQGK
jgi:hypothetical protein